MLSERHADTGILHVDRGRLFLTFADGGRCAVEAWSGADRYVGQRVHLVGWMTQDRGLVAESIAPVRPALDGAERPFDPYPY